MRCEVCGRPALECASDPAAYVAAVALVTVRRGPGPAVNIRDLLGPEGCTAGLINALASLAGDLAANVDALVDRPDGVTVLQAVAYGLQLEHEGLKDRTWRDVV
jgi:hypothetical protein